MNNETSIWNGYPVYGDASELDSIVESKGLINLDKNDVVSVLAAEGDNIVVTGISTSLKDAYNQAVSNLPCEISAINAMLMNLMVCKKPVLMTDMPQFGPVVEGIRSPADFLWGVTSDESLDDSYKVVLVASVKA